jgi:hypothetical protein
MKNTNRTAWCTTVVLGLCLFLLASCSGSGGGATMREFNKETVAKAIMDSIKTDMVTYLKASGKTVEYTQEDEHTGHEKYQAFCNGSNERRNNIADIEEKGMIKAYSDLPSGCVYVSFLEKSAPYTKKQVKSMTVMLATIEKIEVTDLGEGKQARTVKYKVTYAPTPFGEGLLKREDLTEQKEAGFSLSFDEGWRMN